MDPFLASLARSAPGGSNERLDRYPLSQPGSLPGRGDRECRCARDLVSEIVVIDDGSTDETPAAATRNGSVRYLRQERRGLSEARRVADELARAGWRLEAVITDNGSEFRARRFLDRPHPHRPPDQGTGPSRDRLRCAQSEAEMSEWLRLGVRAG
jgi:hypothetical protein